MSRDEISFRYWIEWEEPGPKGVDATVARAEVFVFDQPKATSALLHEARQAHIGSCQGMWVRPHMTRPSVSALYVLRGGRLLDETIRPKHDLDGQPARPAEEAVAR